MNKPTALIDLDGSLADYDAAVARDLAAIRSPYEPENEDFYDESIRHIKARRDLITQRPGWWRNLEPIKNGFTVVQMLRDLDFELMVCTQASAHKPLCWAEKVDWCREHLPGVNLTITHNKSLVYGRVLLDDWPSYGEAWLAHRPRGLLVQVAQPYNEGTFAGDDRVVRFDGTNESTVFERLKIARERNPEMLR